MNNLNENNVIVQQSVAIAALTNSFKTVKIQSLTETAVAVFHKYLLSDSVEVKYTVQFVKGEGNSVTVNTQSQDALVSSVESGNFNSILNETAKEFTNGNSDLIGVTSNKIVITSSVVVLLQDNSDNDGNKDDQSGKLSDGDIAAAVVVPVVVVIFGIVVSIHCQLNTLLFKFD